MRTKHIATAVVLALGLVAHGTAFAQDGEKGVSGDIERVSTAGPEEQKAFSSQAVAEMRGAVKKLSKALDQAKKAGDADEIDCVNDKLTQARALQQVSESASSALSGAADAGETERANHEFRKIAIALNKTRQLVTEADACTSKGGTKSGETNITVEGGLTETEDDTKGTEYDPFDFDVDPPQMSPFS